MKLVHVKLNIVVALIFFSSTLLAQKYMSFEDKVFPEFHLCNAVVSSFCSRQPEYNRLSDNEKYFYFLVNYSRNAPSNFFDSVITPIISLYPQLNGDYLKSLKADFSFSTSLPLLRLNSKLIFMAKRHSRDITTHEDIPSHNSDNGETFSDRFRDNGLKRCGGENISYGSNNPAFLLTLLYLDIGVPSLGHRKALLNQDFTETGIGASFYKNGTIFLVEDFACSQN